MLPQEVSSQQFAQAGAGEGIAQEIENIQQDDVSGQEAVEQKGQLFDEATYRRIAREEAARVAQSFTDKASNRIMQQVQEQIAALEISAGALGLSAEQVDEAKQKIVMKAITAKPQGTQASDSGQPDARGQYQQGLHPVVAQAVAMMEAEQMSIDEGEPEFEQYIKPLLSSGAPDARLLRATSKALDAKAERLAKQRDAAAARAASGAGGGGQPNRKPLTPEEKISKGLSGEWASQEPARTAK